MRKIPAFAGMTPKMTFWTTPIFVSRATFPRILSVPNSPRRDKLMFRNVSKRCTEPAEVRCPEQACPEFIEGSKCDDKQLCLKNFLHCKKKLPEKKRGAD
jgi:hypothetical protein